MRPAFNLDPECRVTMLTREDWTKEKAASPAFKGLVCFKVGCRVREGTGAGFYGKSVGKISGFHRHICNIFFRQRYLLS